MNDTRVPQPVEMIRGTTHHLRFALKNAKKEPYLLGEGEFVRLVVRPAYYKPPVIDKKATSADQDSDGVVTITIKPVDTLDLDIATYKYDLGLQTGDDFYMPVKSSPFLLTENQAAYEAVAK